MLLPLHNPTTHEPYVLDTWYGYVYTCIGLGLCPTLSGVYQGAGEKLKKSGANFKTFPHQRGLPPRSAASPAGDNHSITSATKVSVILAYLPPAFLRPQGLRQGVG